MAIQVLKARPAAVTAAFLLFPTISHIASTPNGRRLSVSILIHVNKRMSEPMKSFPVVFFAVLVEVDLVAFILD